MSWYFWLLLSLAFLNGIACLLAIFWCMTYYPLRGIVRRRRRKLARKKMVA